MSINFEIQSTFKNIVEKYKSNKLFLINKIKTINMKKNDWILTAAVTIYSYLFYKQTAGVNFIVFNIALLALLVIKDNNLYRNKNWLLAVIGCMLSALAIGYYGSPLPVIANIVSLSLMSSISMSAKSSVFFSIIFSFYSYFSSGIFIFLDGIERIKNENRSLDSRLMKIILVVIPFLITILFLFIYKASNPLFNDFAKNINLDFISLDWIAFTLGGFVLLYGFFYHKKIPALSNLDENTSNDLENSTNNTVIFLGKQLKVNDEAFSGSILFILLNSLLFIVNVLDIKFMFIDGKLPADVTYAEFVHQGIGFLIFSILIAIAIILFYFRGALNFYEKNTTIKLLAYSWIIQNAFMLISTVFKNDMYIHEYSLTYKRIGVYVYLFLCVVGLATVFIKILKVKNNNYLFRINGWLFYGVFILFCLFNWDKIIATYNIEVSKHLDRSYLLELSDTNLPQLVLLEQNNMTRNEVESIIREKKAATNVNIDSLLISETENFKRELSKRLCYFMKNKENLHWQSWNFDDERVYDELIESKKSNYQIYKSVNSKQ